MQINIVDDMYFSDVLEQPVYDVMNLTMMLILYNPPVTNIFKRVYTYFI